jgi:hypothetical protein
MIAKPEAGQSLLVLGGALLVSVLMRVPKRRSGSVGLSRARHRRQSGEPNLAVQVNSKYSWLRARFEPHDRRPSN